MEFIGQCDMRINKNDSTDWQEIPFFKKSLEAETQHQRGWKTFASNEMGDK